MSLYQWVALAACVLLMPMTLRYFSSKAVGWGLVDHPNDRKTHQGKTPLVGGIAIFITLSCCLAGWRLGEPMVAPFLVASAIVVFVGLLDDRYDISVRMRLAGQTLAALVVIVLGDVYLVNLGDLLGFGSIDLGVLSVPFTIFAMVGVMNAFNMIDGIDGLLGTSALVAALAFTVLAILQQQHSFIFIGGLLVTALIWFLVFNLRPQGNRYKVFMGDAGSLLLGFTLSWLFILGSQSFGAERTMAERYVLDPVSALFLVALPLMDSVTVIARRLKQRRNPLKADRQHIHHLFEKAGYDQRQTLAWLTIFMVICGLAGVVLQVAAVPELARFAVFLCMLLVYILMTKGLKRKMARTGF